MKDKDKNQGKFHLASIFFIPGFIVTVFLSESWLISIFYLLLSFILLYFLFKRN